MNKYIIKSLSYLNCHNLPLLIHKQIYTLFLFENVYLFDSIFNYYCGLSILHIYSKSMYIYIIDNYNDFHNIRLDCGIIYGRTHRSVLSKNDLYIDKKIIDIVIQHYERYNLL